VLQVCSIEPQTLRDSMHYKRGSTSYKACNNWNNVLRVSLTIEDCLIAYLYHELCWISRYYSCAQLSLCIIWWHILRNRQIKNGVWKWWVKTLDIASSVLPYVQFWDLYPWNACQMPITNVEHTNVEHTSCIHLRFIVDANFNPDMCTLI
jgi:hypothetical protein